MSRLSVFLLSLVLAGCSLFGADEESWKYEVDGPTEARIIWYEPSTEEEQTEARTSLPWSQDIAPAPGDTLYVQGRPRDGTGIVVRLYRDGEVIREDQGRSLAILSYVVED